MMSNFMRRTLRPVQKATSESALVSPAGVMIRAGGLPLYSAFRAAALLPITAFFHSCKGGKAPSDFPVGVAVWPKQQGSSVASVSAMQLRITIRDSDLMHSPMTNRRVQSSLAILMSAMIRMAFQDGESAVK